MLPYCRHVLGEEEIAAAHEALRSGWIARGPRSRAFEDAVAEHLGARHAVSCGSGSAGLELALRALEIGPGDEVLVPSLTWVATAMAVKLLGARPVFMDVDAETHCASVSSGERFVSERTRAAILVDFAGQPVDRAAWGRFASRHGIALIADAAHAFGARLGDGRAVGADGTADLTVFSFHPAKTITTGEGGLVTTADGQLAARLRLARGGGVQKGFPGARGPWDLLVEDLGGNHHMTEVQAAIGLVQLRRLDELLDRRRGLWARYHIALAAEVLGVQGPRHDRGSALNLFVVRLPDSPGGALRDAVATRLREAGIGVHVHYPLLHRQPVFRGDAPPEDPLLPQSVAYERRALTLPLFPELDAKEPHRVVRALREALIAEGVGATEIEEVVDA